MRTGRRCAECGYSLESCTSQRCPECGTAFLGGMDSAIHSVTRLDRIRLMVTILIVCACGFTAQFYGIQMLGGGHNGTLLPLIIAFGPLALMEVSLAMIFGGLLFALYGLILTAARLVGLGRIAFALVVLVHHACAVLAISMLEARGGNGTLHDNVANLLRIKSGHPTPLIVMASSYVMAFVILAWTALWKSSSIHFTQHDG